MARAVGRSGLAVLLAGGLLTGCTGGAPAPTSSALLPGTTASVSTVPAPTPAAETSAPARRVAAPATVTGIGATDADWNAYHTADPRYAPGAAFNPDPAIGMDRYQAVQHSDGHVIQYTMRFSPETLSRAELLVKAEVPRDAHVLWTATRDVCVQMSFRSATLAHAAATLGDGHGYAFVELDNAGGATLDRAHLDEAFVWLISAPTVGDAPGC